MNGKKNDWKKNVVKNDWKKNVVAARAESAYSRESVIVRRAQCRRFALARRCLSIAWRLRPMLAWVRTAKSWFCLAPATLHMSNHSTSRVRSHGLSFTVARWSRSMDCRLRCVVKNTRTAMSWSSLPVVAGTLVSTRSTCSATTDVFALIENKERFIICSKFVVATIAGVLFAATICSCQTSENMQYVQYSFVWLVCCVLSWQYVNARLGDSSHAILRFFVHVRSILACSTQCAETCLSCFVGRKRCK